jgi:hypothetical protein
VALRFIPPAEHGLAEFKQNCIRISGNEFLSELTGFEDFVIFGWSVQNCRFDVGNPSGRARLSLIFGRVRLAELLECAYLSALLLSLKTTRGQAKSADK